MSWRDLLVSAAATAVLGLVLLALIWPSERKGARVLGRWGVADPSPAEVGYAVIYLKRRRVWYPVMFVGVSLVTSAAGFGGPGRDDQPFLLQLVVVLLAGALLAELWAQRPPRGRPRSAVLTPRRITDLVPAWSIGLAVLLFVFDAVVSVAGLAGTAWARSGRIAPQWPLLGAFGVALVGAGACWLAVRRPVAGEPRADDALRVRSARVALGLTIGALAMVFSVDGTSRFGIPATLFVPVIGLIGWVWTVRQPSRVPSIASRG